MKRDNANNDRNARNPENNPSKAMDSKKEVEQSPDEKTDQDFPGYPHYPAKEDIMNQRSENSRVDLDVENLPSSRNAQTGAQRNLAGQNRERAEEAMIPGPATDDELQIKRGTEADVNSDDLAALNATNSEIGTPQNVSNEDLDDLDIPGSELDDANEAIGEEDEENNYYSLGGDNHENLEEDKA
jgi:hypothetical protein